MVMDKRPSRRWGAGTSAIVRSLIAATRPASQSGLAVTAGVSQPRVSQVLTRLSTGGAVSSRRDGYHPNKKALIELYIANHRPALTGPETYWYGLDPLADQVTRLVETAQRQSVGIAVSADLAPDLLVAWRHPTVTIVYADAAIEMASTGLVPAEGRSDATLIIRATDDRTLLTPGEAWPRAVAGIPLADPTQQIWDLHYLGGEDRREGANRLRDAMLADTHTTAR